MPELALPRGGMLDSGARGDGRRFMSEECAEKLSTFQWRSWVDDNPKVKWCTGPGCERAVISERLGEGVPVDVHCECGNAFCWNCQGRTRIGPWIARRCASGSSRTVPSRRT